MTTHRPDMMALRKVLGRLFLRANGWRLSGEIPDIPKMIVIAAPHTSSWDLTYMLAVASGLGVKLSWFGRKGLFEGPLGGFLRAMGGIPIDRASRNNVVEQAIAAFDRADELYLLIAPEGRLARTEHWKSGFYHIAYGAGVPIGLSFLDFERKVGGMGPILELTGDVKADMDEVRAFYSQIGAKNPERFGPIRLKDEAHLEPMVEPGDRSSPTSTAYSPPRTT